MDCIPAYCASKLHPSATLRPTRPMKRMVLCRKGTRSISLSCAENTWTDRSTCIYLVSNKKVPQKSIVLAYHYQNSNRIWQTDWINGGLLDILIVAFLYANNTLTFNLCMYIQIKCSAWHLTRQKHNLRYKATWLHYVYDEEKINDKTPQTQLCAFIVGSTVTFEL